MSSEFNEELDIGDLERECRRLSLEQGDSWEKYLCRDREEMWGSSDSDVLLIAPQCANGGVEVRRYDDDVWLARDGTEYWFIESEALYRVPLVYKQESDANKTLWESSNTDVFAVVRDVSGFRQDSEPELVRSCPPECWLSLWRGVCEVWSPLRIDDLELVPEAEWETARPETRYTQVQNRIAARLRQRGLTPVVPVVIPLDGGIDSGREGTPTLNAWNVWDLLHSQVYVWVKSCRIDIADEEVRHWHGDDWVARRDPSWCWTVTTAELRDWGCLVSKEAWDRSQRERREPVNWRETGF